MVQINNKEYAWGDIKIVVLGRTIEGCTGIEYKIKQAKEAKFGAGRQAKSIQYGKEEVEGTLTVMQSELIALNQAGRAKGYQNALGFDFDIIITYLAGTTVTIDKISCASLTELPGGMKEGDMQAEIALSFIALAVDYDMTGV